MLPCAADGRSSGQEPVADLVRLMSVTASLALRLRTTSVSRRVTYLPFLKVLYRH